MPDPQAPLKLGADIWNQYVDWPAFKAAHLRAEDLGFDSLWTMDHIFPPMKPSDGPILEAHTLMAAIAEITSRAAIGVLVASNTYRNPAMLTKIVTTLDHISGGRAILGVGAGWAEHEHEGFGFDFGASPGERLRWLEEALPVMCGMRDGIAPSSSGPRYAIRDAHNEPRPLQPRMPILIGGGGRKVTLRLVAEYADMCNVGGTPADVQEAEAALLGHCEAVGRDESEIERSVVLGAPLIRDSRERALADMRTLFEANRMETPKDDPAGTPEDLVERFAPYVEMGYRHLLFYLPAPYDEETMARLTTEVRPRLQALIDG